MRKASLNVPFSRCFWQKDRGVKKPETEGLEQPNRSTGECSWLVRR